MTIEHHYYCVTSPERDGSLVQFLEENKVKYHITYDLITFDLCENTQVYKDCSVLFPEVSAIWSRYRFTEKEINDAAWLTMKSTNNTKLTPVDWLSTFKYECDEICRHERFGKIYQEEMAYHAIQVAPYTFSKQVKWGKNFFYSCVTGGRETMFCNDLATDVITSVGLKGCSFMPVRHYKKNCFLSDVNQMVFENIIPDDSVQVQGIEKIWNCPMCGKPKYITSSLSRPIIRKEALRDMDFYSTTENHTGFKDDTRPDAWFIISQKAYQILKEHKMIRSLEFFPLLTY